MAVQSETRQRYITQNALKVTVREFLYRIRYAAAACVVLLLLAMTAVYVEYRTNVAARWLGAYLAGNNASRSSTGRLWEMITSETKARQSLPDSLLEQTLPTDIPALVRTRRLSIERIPEEGLPGYFAILTQNVPASEREIVDAGRLVNGVRIHRIGRRILQVAQLDPSPFLLEARQRAEAMGMEVEALTPAGETDSVAVAVAGLPILHENGVTPDTSASWVDTAGFPAETVDTVGVLPPDSIAASVVETFASVILDEKLAAQKRLILADWDSGQIDQLFVNRALGDYQGELYYLDSAHPVVNFTILADSLSDALGIPRDEDPE